MLNAQHHWQKVFLFNLSAIYDYNCKGTLWIWKLVLNVNTKNYKNKLLILSVIEMFVNVLSFGCNNTHVKV